MTIGFDAKRAFQNTTGLGNYSRFILKALLHYEPQNQYLAYTPNKDTSLFKEFPQLQIRNPQSTFRNPFWRSRFIINQLQEDKVQIFHGLSNELPLGIRQKKIKSVVTIHDLIFIRYPKLYPFIDRQIYFYKFKKACEQADVIIAISEQTKADIIEFFKIREDKIQVIYQDCDEVFQQKVTPQKSAEVQAKYQLNKPYLLCVATLAERKNQLRLVQAFEQLDTKHNLVLVGGKTAYQTQIEAYIQKRNLNNRVKIINNVPFADLPALYQGTDLFVYPSLFEGFGIPILEALHSGVPVVTSEGSCFAEAGGEVTIYANPLNINDLSLKIQIGLGQKNNPIQVLEHLKQFSAKAIAGKLVGVYEGV